jgi:AcrR family transcriptional regulator
MALRNGSASEDPDKHQAILDQAIRTFAELGFRGTDVQVIADRAGVGKGTVYRYFHSKEELFWAATFEVLTRLEQVLFGAVADVEGAGTKIRASAVAYAKFFESNPQYLEMFVQERAEFRGTGPESHREHHQKMVRRFGEVLMQGIEAGELRPVDTERVTLTLGSLLYGTVVLGCHLTPASPMEMADFGIEIFLRGLRADVPRAEVETCCTNGSENR